MNQPRIVYQSEKWQSIRRKVLGKGRRILLLGANYKWALYWLELLCRENDSQVAYMPNISEAILKDGTTLTAMSVSAVSPSDGLRIDEIFYEPNALSLMSDLQYCWLHCVLAKSDIPTEFQWWPLIDEVDEAARSQNRRCP